MSLNVFRSIIHFDIGLYFFYKGQPQNAVPHFQQQSLPTEDFPYLRVTRKRLDGYLKGLGLLTLDKKSQDMESTEPRFLQIEKLLRTADYEKLQFLLEKDFGLKE